MTILDRIGIAVPLVQTGMGGLSRHELAAAVSEAGGLGTTRPSAPRDWARGQRRPRLTGRRVPGNLLPPFARRSWFEGAAPAVVVTFWG